jgi:hypothetical protein
MDEACQALQDTRELAEAIGSSRVLWPVCDNLADLEWIRGNGSNNRDHRKQSREIIEYLANHIDDPERRSVFLRLSSVEVIFAR